ncbi:hypothetical protein DTW90_33475 [Neorhizobium sp. P12A]|uniref:hypothetical protein n=1 Tax=Neorhizobium sp. P12A TaxID=2268027 RepID=UPI0011F05F76|nr:hypothetical protein [Neorhizobium sp. P12A]KAA0687372.1 hypothetical protein DTW90_33475 [Neorhizobium sp. P12A]
MTTIKEKQSAPISPPDTRQGALGKPVLIVLVSALILAAVGWIGVEFWGEHIDPDKSATSAPAPGPSTNSGAQPAGTASGGQTPQATTIDKSENNQLGITSTPAQPSRDGVQN